MIRSLAVLALVLVTASAAAEQARPGAGQERPARASEHSPVAVSTLRIDNARAIETLGKSRNASVYLDVRNSGTREDRLRAARSDIARRAELHTHSQDGAIMRMRSVTALHVPAGGRLTLRTGGHHVMLMGLRRPLRPGDEFDLTLSFARAGDVAVRVTVVALGARRH